MEIQPGNLTSRNTQATTSQTFTEGPLTSVEEDAVVQDPLAVGDEGLRGAVLAAVDVLLHGVQVHRTGHELAVVGELLLVHWRDERLRLNATWSGNHNSSKRKTIKGENQRGIMNPTLTPNFSTSF